MRVHLPALLALVSAASYVACGSADASKAVPETGGAGGEAGESTSSGGSNNVAGSKNSGGSLSMVGGQGGESTAGQGGASGSDGGMVGGAAGADTASAGAGGSGDTTGDMSLPAACPGVIGDYTLKVGTESADHYLLADLNGKNLIFGLGGDDVFDYDTAGEDCLIGGPGNDDFTSPGEFASHFFGGSGADVFHITKDYATFNVEDMESDTDSISLLQTAFPFLLGTPGSPLDAQQVLSIPGYATGAASIPASEASGAIVYDPNDGSVWRDLDRGDNKTGQRQIGKIANYSSYTFSADDFVLE
jgi:hypothetical protein